MNDPPRSPKPPLIAHPAHTVLCLAIVVALAWSGNRRASLLQSGGDPDRIYSYLRTMVSEWILLAFVLAGIHFYGASIWNVLGKRWRSIRDLARDFGIGLAFWMFSLVVTSILGSIGRVGDDNSAIAFLLPHGMAEATLWIVLSITAGICEEAVYRGYFQQQFIAMTKNIPVGIVLGALLFGGVHLYQGWQRAAVIVVGATMSGLLTHWLQSVRPAMIAHSLQDSLAPLLLKLVKHSG